MTSPGPAPERGMTFLEHLDELRSRLLRSAAAFVVALALCWGFSGPILRILLVPIRLEFFAGGEIIFIRPTEPFLVYMGASALAAVFLASPYVLYQLWAFVSPGLYRNERRLAVGFIVAGTAFFLSGGAFGYLVALPLSARWLLALGEDFRAQLTLDSTFRFASVVILGMGLVFELPVVILVLSRLGLVTPAFLMRHFRLAVLLIAIAAAVITPTGDILTMTVFGAPMVLLYLLGVGVSWAFGRREAVVEREA